MSLKEVRRGSIVWILDRAGNQSTNECKIPITPAAYAKQANRMRNNRRIIVIDHIHIIVAIVRMMPVPTTIRDTAIPPTHPQRKARKNSPSKE